MRPEKRDAALLWDMLEAARSAQRFVHGVTLKQFHAHDMLKRAVEREIEIIGEAAGGVSDALRPAHPEIPWRAMVAQRNVLVHDYGDVDHERVWQVVPAHLPRVVEQLAPLIPEPPQE